MIGTTGTRNSQMRAQLYLMLSRDGESPQSQMVSGLEERIGDNVHVSGPLLLAYGALVSRATPALQ